MPSTLLIALSCRPRFAGAILHVLIVLFSAGCTSKSSGPSGSPTLLTPVSSLGAYSLDDSSVGLTWNASMSASTPFARGISVVARYGGATVLEEIIPATSTYYVATSLVEGRPYEFEVTLLHTLAYDQYGDSPTQKIVWAPAFRFLTFPVDGSPIILFESSSTNGAGVQCFFDSLQGPRSIRLGSSLMPSVDLFFFSGTTSLRAGDQFPATVRGTQTRISTYLPRTTSTLNDSQQGVPDDASYTLLEYAIPTGTTASGEALYARTPSNHIVRILILSGKGNSLIQGTSPNRYVQLQFSVQRIPYIPFAMR